MLDQCGHSFCNDCLHAVKEGDKYLCTQCKRYSSSTSENPEVLKTFEKLEKRQCTDGGSEKFVVDCPHIKSVASDMLESCKHCGRNFCSVCSVGHKELIRWEAEMISDNVYLILFLVPNSPRCFFHSTFRSSRLLKA